MTKMASRSDSLVKMFTAGTCLTIDSIVSL